MSSAEEGTFAGAEGARLFTQCWRPRAPSGEPRAVVGIVHGIGEHSGRYTSLVEHLSESGFVVCGFDHRGHGRSPGRRGHIGSWSEYRDDVGAFLAYVRREFPVSNVFLYGHSLGALIAAEYALSHQEGLAGLIVSGIPLKPTGVAKPHLVALARMLSRVLPSFSVSLGVNAAALSRDADVVRAYDSDPLVHHRASMRWGTETLAAIDRVRSRASAIRVPILILHGEADAVNSVEGSRELLAKVSSSDKQLRVYPGGFHEPHNDLQREQVVGDVEEWLRQHL